MVSTGGVDSTPPQKSDQTHHVTPPPQGGKDGKNILVAMDTPVRTMGQLKSILIDNLGKKEGQKLYRAFLQSFIMTMLAPVRTAQKQAQVAARKMRQQNG